MSMDMNAESAKVQGMVEERVGKIVEAVNRRSFLTAAGVAAAGAALAGASTALGQAGGPGIPAGDVAILKFLAAAELVEDDLWQQYTELAENNPGYRAALERIRAAQVAYIAQDRDDERSHAALINAFLVSIGETPVNLDGFRKLPSSRAPGAAQAGRLTNLTRLNIDTSYYTRYRGTGNPDFGDTFPQVVTLTNRPTIPLSRNHSQAELQAMAHSASFHFAAIEQGGSSLYLNLLQRVQSPQAKLILASIGPTEVYHFAVFQTALEGIFGITTPDGVVFPDLRGDRVTAFKVMPAPCRFLNPAFPLCSVIRPASTANAGAVAAATGLVQSGLFIGQPPAFLNAVVALAQAADAA